MGNADNAFSAGKLAGVECAHRVPVPPPRSFLDTFRANFKETFFPDDPFRQFKNVRGARRLVLGLQYFFPFLEWAPRYTLDLFKSDLIAGITVASLAIPQGISYAKLANLPPILGLYSSFVPPLVYAMMGSSRDLAVGTVAVGSLLLSSMLGKEVSAQQNPTLYLHLAFTATFFSGVFQAGLGLLRLGFIVDFLSHATIVGFMAGAATVVCLQQLKGILGLEHFTTSTDLISVMKSIFSQTHLWRWESAVLGCSFLSRSPPLSPAPDPSAELKKKGTAFNPRSAARAKSKKLKTLETTETPPPPPEDQAMPAPSPAPAALATAPVPVPRPSPPSPAVDPSAELKKKGTAFNPRAAASWKDGDPVPFLFLARALELISDESGRIAITEILCNVFRTVIATTPGDLLATVYLAANRIAAPHEGIELGIGDASLVRALSEAYGRNEEQVKKQLKDLGDLGLVAKASRSSQKVMFKPQRLTIAKVLVTFRAIAKESGKDSQDKKRNHIKGLLVAATDCEPQYIIRLLQSKMRIGLAEKTVLVALGQAAVYSGALSEPPREIQSPLEEAAKIIKRVYSVLPIYDKIIPALLKVGVWELSNACDFSLGVPIGPMLAKPTKAVSEIVDKFEGMEFTCEYKYDGERAQIHCMEDGSVEIYSRNAERNTGKYPDVVNYVSRFKKPSTKSFVLDCEIVAFDREKKKILPFQVLSTRARKGVVVSDIKVAVCTFAFDILYINGRPLLKEQLKVRRELLYSSFEEVPGEFHFATTITSKDLEEIQKFLEAAVNSSSEGLIIKTLDKDATYEPSKRSNNWLKLKKDYMESIGDSLDLVPIGAYKGRGKRTGVYGSFLLACYDEHNEEYQSICNIGTGFSEAQLEERSESLIKKLIPKPKPYYRYADTKNPDVWFEPGEVWEVKAADLSISPVHRAAFGTVDSNKGISLRFPRLLRVREDKNPEQATTSEQVADMYRAQKFNHASNKEDEDDD